MIKLVNIEKSFDGYKVLNKLNLDIPENKITAIVGLSGSGKSVILKHVMGLMKPDKGKVFLDGEDITNMGRKKLRNIRKSYSMLFQSAGLIDFLDVFENVSLPLRELSDMSSEEIEERVERELEQVGILKKDYKKYPAQLSGGMKKRVGLARAMITKPKTIFFDEPTTGLDPKMTNHVHSLIKITQRRSKLTVVVVSHEIPKIFSVADYVAVLHDGKIVEFDTSQKVLHSKNPSVSNLVKEANNEV